jgi:hypothetical protein
MTTAELIERLKAWARRYEPRSPERTLFLESVEQLTSMEQRIAEASSDGVTVESVEKAIGSPLLKWQRQRLEAKAGDTPPPPSVA